MRHVGGYDIDDPQKIQGRDEVTPTQRSVAAIRLRHALAALEGVHGRVLLPGCGAGRYVRALRRERPDLTVVGADLSRRAILEARELDPNGKYILEDASSLPHPDQSFSAVVFFDLLEHVPEYRVMLREIARVLQPGGILHFYTPLEDQPRSVYHALRESKRLPIRRWKRDHVGHINFFRAEDVIRDIWDAQLEPIDIRYGFHPFGQIHDVVDYWQRERRAGSDGWLPLSAVNALARITFLFTWRLSYLEDRLYEGRTLASGLHLTALRHSQ